MKVYHYKMYFKIIKGESIVRTQGAIVVSMFSNRGASLRLAA